MKEKTSHNKFKRVLTFPIRALAKARDLYVDAMNGYADRVCYSASGASTFGLAVADPLPRSFSATSLRSSDVDLKELIRAASSRAHSDKIDLNNTPTGKGIKRVTRSASVSMDKIDEDKICEHGVEEDEDDIKKKRPRGLFSRSRSYAALSSTTMKRF